MKLLSSWPHSFSRASTSGSVSFNSNSPPLSPFPSLHTHTRHSWMAAKASCTGAMMRRKFLTARKNGVSMENRRLLTKWLV